MEKFLDFSDDIVVSISSTDSELESNINDLFKDLSDFGPVLFSNHNSSFNKASTDFYEI